MIKVENLKISDKNKEKPSPPSRGRRVQRSRCRLLFPRVLAGSKGRSGRRGCRRGQKLHQGQPQRRRGGTGDPSQRRRKGRRDVQGETGETELTALSRRGIINHLFDSFFEMFNMLLNKGSASDNERISLLSIKTNID